MLMTFDEASKMILSGSPLHIAGTEALIRKLPKGNWAGGSTEYFMTEDGGKVSGDLLYVTKFPYDIFSVKTYDAATIHQISADAFDNGFTVAIIPFDSAVHREYAENAPGFEGMFIKNITGWISGSNLDIPDQTPVVVNGQTGETHTDKAVALHIRVPDGKTVSVNIVNIFSQDENSPVIEFTKDGFLVEKCLVNGKEVVFADYIAQNGIDTKLPLIGDYSGNGINTSFQAVEGGVVHFYAPVFSGIKYRTARGVSDYAQEFNSRLAELKDTSSVFSCNCLLNFLYGELEGKNIDAFAGPITFGEIAYQLVNQTLVYVTVVD